MAKKSVPKKPKKPHFDRSARKTVRKFSQNKNEITTGAIQKSFHNDERKDNPRNYSGTFPIVAIGASAGGVESYSELLSHIPKDTGMSFVLIQHLSPKHESLLPEILARISPMNVLAADTGMVVEPNHVYIIPPNTNMGIINGILKLIPRIESPARHMPIDFFLRCLADDQGHLGIGIILSGADGDGAQGLRAVRAQGGITIVQDPKTAKVNGMPRSAIAAGGTDCIMSIPEISQELIRLGSHPLAKISPEETRVFDDLSKIFRILKTRTNVDFAKYKRAPFCADCAVAFCSMALRTLPSI